MPFLTSPTMTHSLVLSPPSTSLMASHLLALSAALSDACIITRTASSLSDVTRKSRPESKPRKKSEPAMTASITSTVAPTSSVARRLTSSKLSFLVPEPEDLLICGALETYDQTFDRAAPKNERRLERFKNKNFFMVTITDDPVIRRLANEDNANVFVEVGLQLGYSVYSIRKVVY